MKLENYLNKTIDNVTYKIPKSCPHCDYNIIPQIIFSKTTDNPSKKQFDSILLAQCPNCNLFYILPYEIIGKDKNNLYYIAEYSPYPCDIEISLDLPKEVVKISPKFYEIIKQTLQAEKLNLFHISAMGYRKAVEFLIKDYLIHFNPNDEEKISKMHLGPAINKLDNDTILALAKAANMISNDHVHYLRKYPNKDINDVKRFIKSLVLFIAMEINSRDSEDFLASL